MESDSVRIFAPAQIDDDPVVVDRTIAEIAARLAMKAPHATVAYIVEVVADCLAATRGAKVQNFRLVLAEREAGRRLGTASSRAGDGPRPHEPDPDPFELFGARDMIDLQGALIT